MIECIYQQPSTSSEYEVTHPWNEDLFYQSSIILIYPRIFLPSIFFFPFSNLNTLKLFYTFYFSFKISSKVIYFFSPSIYTTKVYAIYLLHIFFKYFLFLLLLYIHSLPWCAQLHPFTPTSLSYIHVYTYNPIWIQYIYIHILHIGT